MPTGTGKTVSLLSLFISYLNQYPDRFRRVSNLISVNLLH
jgi:hypothetical protein